MGGLSEPAVVRHWFHRAHGWLCYFRDPFAFSPFRDLKQSVRFQLLTALSTGVGSCPAPTRAAFEHDHEQEQDGQVYSPTSTIPSRMRTG